MGSIYRLMHLMWCRDLDYGQMSRWFEAMNCIGTKPSQQEYEMFCIRKEIEMDDYFKNKKIARIKPMTRQNTYHTHTDERGFVHKCYHKTKAMFLDVGFYVGITVSFPFEHFLYEKVFPFTVLTKWLGL